MAANNSYGFNNDGYRSSYAESTYSRTAPSYPGRNMQNYSYPKGSQNTQQMGYVGHHNYMDSNPSYEARKDNRAQQSSFNQGFQESNTYENMPPSSSYDHGQGYQEVEPQNQEYDNYMEEKRDSRKGSWNMPTWDMNRASSYSSSEPVAYQEAPSSYHHQQRSRFGHGSWGGKDSSANGTGTRYAKNAPYLSKDMKFKGQPKPPQLHYCDICRISCAGYQTYKEHLEGQKHKKKELTVASQISVRSAHTQLHCQLCDISCTGPDAYTAHIKGAKHQKVVKLHTRLGKPIPDSEPVVTPGPSSKSQTFTSTGMQTQDNSRSLENSAKPESLACTDTSAVSSTGSKQTPSLLEMEEGHMEAQDMFSGNSSEPVGEGYVEEIQNEEGKILRFHCKLCECSFNDSSARDMHLKGRRHRLQFKKKVNPRRSIEVKLSNRPWQMQEENMWRRWEHKRAMQRYLEEEQKWLMEMRHYEDMYWRERELEEEHLFWEYQQMRRMQLEWSHVSRGRPRYPRYNSPQVNESVDDRYIMRRHAQIYPTEKELQAIQKTVSLSERALKLVSDCIRHESGDKDTSRSGSACLLRGVKRVGILSKGLILRGNQDFQLTLLCSNKPTCSLLKRIAEVLPEQLKKLSKKQHSVTYDMGEAYLLITFSDEPMMKFTVFLTCNHLIAKNREKKEAVVKKDTEPKEGVEKKEDTEPKEGVEKKEDTEPKEGVEKRVDTEPKEGVEKKEDMEEKEDTNPKEDIEKKDVQTEDLEKEEKDTCTASEENELLSKKKCKESLIRLHQAQWFQSHASDLQSCVIVIRILRDLRQRVPVWRALSDWALELLVQKALSCSPVPLSPAEATRRVLECIASGVLLYDGPGLQDPCQKETFDVLESLANQEREDITANAQQALRMISFRQIHKVLDMEPLRTTRQNRQNRKRPRDNSDSGLGQGKKDKKENVENVQKPE